MMEQLASLDAKQGRADRRITGLQTIVKVGMKLLVGVQEAQKKNEVAIRDLVASQKKTEVAIRDLTAAQKKTEESLRKTDEVVRQLALSQKRWFDRHSNGKS